MTQKVPHPLVINLYKNMLINNHKKMREAYLSRIMPINILTNKISLIYSCYVFVIINKVLSR